MEPASSLLAPTQAGLLSPLVEAFAREFAENEEGVPDFIVFSPGRINIIGEHLDYSGYDVLPMAINRYSTFAVRSLSDCSTKSSSDSPAAGQAAAASPATEAAAATGGASPDEEAAATQQHQMKMADADVHVGKRKKADLGVHMSCWPAAAAQPYFLRLAHTHLQKYGSVTLESPQHLLEVLLQFERETQETAVACRETREGFSSAAVGGGTCKNGSSKTSSSSRHRTSGSGVRVSDQQTTVDPAQAQEKQQMQKLEWHLYVCAALLGVLEYYHGGAAAVGQMLQRASTWGRELHQIFQRGQLPAIQLLVGGDLPTAAGLASSSSLVVGAVVATAAALRLPLSRGEVAFIATEAERYVKTAGGGMDQAVIVLTPKVGRPAAAAGAALHVAFEPQLRTEAVPLPAGLCFAVCHTTAESPKAGPLALTRFNKRVLECYLAALLLAKIAAPASLKTTDEETLRCWTLRKTQELSLCLPSLHECAAAAAERLHAAPYTKDEIREILGSSLFLQCTRKGFLRSCLFDAWEANDHFYLRQRAQHVYTEAARVHEFVNACTSAKQKPRSETLQALGALMKASQLSCSRLFDCSCEEADTLVSLSDSLPGVVGARITGAGWGGCIIALLESQERGPHFLQELDERFYSAPVESLPPEAAAAAAAVGAAALAQQQRTPASSPPAAWPSSADAETAAAKRGGSGAAVAVAGASGADAEARTAAAAAAESEASAAGNGETKSKTRRENVTVAKEDLMFLAKPAGGVMLYEVKKQRRSGSLAAAATGTTSSDSSKPSGVNSSCSPDSVTDSRGNAAGTSHSSSISSSTVDSSSSSTGPTDSSSSAHGGGDPVAVTQHCSSGDSVRGSTCSRDSSSSKSTHDHASSSVDNNIRTSNGSCRDEEGSSRRRSSSDSSTGVAENGEEESVGQWIAAGKNCLLLQEVLFTDSSCSVKRQKVERQ